MNIGIAVASPICALLVWLAAKGLRLPLIFCVGTAGLPWPIAAFWSRESIVFGLDAVFEGTSTPSAAAEIYAERVLTLVYGAWMSGGLLAGIALGLALGAVQGRPRREW